MSLAPPDDYRNVEGFFSLLGEKRDYESKEAFISFESFCEEVKATLRMFCWNAITRETIERTNENEDLDYIQTFDYPPEKELRQYFDEQKEKELDT